ncbi:PREDICTED: uncharacterized protein LOC107073575 [Polistes dominula]|uniref:Uncharacterized protein LOC107073575 n=1 Tax=Polistes dominula TaxID=743375 RepID=A0ABM1JBC0_POLDO|nr:PREDICTED: uncharacterized protein LOC107073575 [Polistes dominula]
MTSQKQLEQKQNLGSRLTHFENLIEEGSLSVDELRRRYERLTKQVDDYESLYEKCGNNSAGETGVDDLDQLIERYHVIGDKIHLNDTAAVNNPNNSNENNDITKTRDQQIQLRRLEIPRFDGNIGKWIPFKSSLLTLVDARSDISDLEKHVYFRDSFPGEALQTIEHYQLTGEKYKDAWGALLRAFDVPRILLARVIDALIDIPRPKAGSAKDVTAFLNELRSHISTLETFNESSVAWQVRLAERALPPEMLQEWNKQIDSDEYLTIEQFFNFLTRYARACASLETSSTPRTSSPAQNVNIPRR